MWFSKNQNYVAANHQDIGAIEIRARDNATGNYTKWADETIPSDQVMTHTREEIIELRDFLNFLLDESETV